jgi:hypothetical protein
MERQMNFEKLLDRLVIFWFPLLVALVLLVSVSHAKPVAHLSEQGLQVTLYDEPCKLDVKLQYRVVWKDKEKTYEGCWGVMQGIVVAMFDDKSIALFPGQAFRAMTES